jgi:alkyl sulfatase BDS1-like metallo-beta-lactamase superfamily hydrolase
MRRRAGVVGTLLALGLAACAGGSGGSSGAAPDAASDADGALADGTDDRAADSGADAEPGPDSDLIAWCSAAIGAPVVEQPAPGLFVARGYDLANTIVLQTPDGNVVIDVGMSPARAAVTRAALDAVAPGPVRAIIYTHSHIDHTGGASVWAEDSTEIWATDALFPELVRQYGALRPAESARAELQFGAHVPEADLPCSALGRRADVVAALSTGVRKPTRTFSGDASFEVGGVQIQLIEAHGETADHLMVWLPQLQALLVGDNFYAAFPNLYTIRGTRPRPVDAWIDSLDVMRGLDPELIVPSHTRTVLGREAVRSALTDYRDAIQWLRDSVVRGANAGLSLDALVASVRLPERLAASPNLDERYGQVDWSVRALYTGELGWFDGRTHALYPPANPQQAEIALMGGAAAVREAAVASLDGGDPRLALHLLGKLLDSGAASETDLAPDLIRAYRAVAATVPNTNGRGWLLEAALRLAGEVPAAPQPTLDDVFVDELPVAVLFAVMPSRLLTDKALAVEESLHITLTDTAERWVLTVRRGVAEVREGDPLPGSPTPVATLTTTSLTWKRLALQLLDPLQALGDGLLESDDLFAVISFLGRFDQGL